jgi:hypothetical protein
MSSVPRREPAPLITVGDSPLPGLGVFALRRIARGARVVARGRRAPRR